MESNNHNTIWHEKPEIIKKFLNINHDYQQLCTEIEYTLRKRVSDKNIEFAAITSRAKTLDSFIDKIQRKNYANPFEEITDIAGVRLVCLYLSDIEKVNTIIKSEFDVQEEINKKENLKDDQFGYGAQHFIVKLGKSSSGARYDYLKEMVCEIQVRTIVQDAWSIIQHHMVYKKESETPSKLLRKLNSLSALFETVDDQFESIRNERESYLKEMINSRNNKIKFLENELNLDTFKEYLNWKYPERVIEAWDGQASLVMDALVNAEFKYLHQVDQLIEETKDIRQKLIDVLDKKIKTKKNDQIPSNIEPALALTAKNEKWRNLIPWPNDWNNIISRVLI